MFEKIFWFGVGYLVARYLVLNTPDYQKKEAEKIDQLREQVHNLVKKYAPEADDAEIGADVLITVSEK